MKQAEDSGQPFIILVDEHLSGLETLALEIRAFKPTPRIVALRQAAGPAKALDSLSAMTRSQSQNQFWNLTY